MNYMCDACGGNSLYKKKLFNIRKSCLDSVIENIDKKYLFSYNF